MRPSTRLRKHAPDDVLLRHGTHDQSSHGNWSVGNLDAAPGVGLDVAGDAEIQAIDGKIGRGETDLPDLAGANRADVEAAGAEGAANVVAKMADDKAAAVDSLTAKGQARDAVRNAAKQRHADALSEQFGDLMEPGDQRQAAAEFADKVDNAMLDLQGKRVLGTPSPGANTDFDVGDDDGGDELDDLLDMGGDRDPADGFPTGEAPDGPGVEFPQQGQGGNEGGGAADVPPGGFEQSPPDPDASFEVGGPSPGTSSGSVENVVPGASNPSTSQATDPDLLDAVTSAEEATDVSEASTGVQGVTFANIGGRDVVVRRNQSDAVADDPAIREFATGTIAEALGADKSMPGMALVNPGGGDAEEVSVVQERFGSEFGMGSDAGLRVNPAPAALRDLNPEDVARIGAIDYVTSNSDRHAQNFMVDGSGNTRAIDHGLTLQAASNPMRDGQIEGLSATGSSPFTRTRSAREFMVNEVDWSRVRETADGLLADLDDGTLPAKRPDDMRRRLDAVRQIAERAEGGEFHADGRWMEADEFISNANSGV